MSNDPTATTQETPAPMRSSSVTSVARWDHIELTIDTVAPGDPFAHHPLVDFTIGHRSITVEGFYDGDDTFLVRFMPDHEGQWHYRSRPTGSHDAVTEGEFTCVPAAEDNHGPVRVHDATRFQYADGSPYRPYGTTCYAWGHQPAATQDRTLRALQDSPFNKLRMCVFPKHYPFNADEPPRFPFPRATDGTFDLHAFDLEFFEVLEQQILVLKHMGIECDLILFHPYDGGRWGFDRMPRDADQRYLRYLLARVSAFRNVWWSLANEYDFMKEKHTHDWDQAFADVERFDPYQHLASIHNGTRMYEPSSLALYDHRHPWVSHVSLQHWDLQQMRQWRTTWGKPVVVDECGYEGDLPYRWGDLTAQSVVDMFWTGSVLGGHVGHGETFRRDDGVIWWSQGGDLIGESPARIAYLRDVFEQLPYDSAPLSTQRDVPTFGVEGQAYLQYFGSHRPGYRVIDLPEDRDFTVEVIDTWQMTAQPIPGTHRGSTRVELPARPGIALLARASTG